MGSSAQPHFFFGEDYTVFKNRFHVVTAAYGFFFIETLLLLLSLVVLPLTVISFDVFSVVKGVINGGALLLALVAMFRKQHRLLWAFMCVKVIEIVVYVILFLTALVLCCTKPKALIHFMRWRIRTIDQSNQVLHIVGLLIVFLCYIVYCAVAVDVVHRVFSYFRERAIFVYLEERRQTFQHIMYFAIPRWIALNWIAVILTTVLSTVALVVFNRILAPYLTEHYKSCLGYERRLSEMKSQLETDYGSFWEDPEFCVGYLKLHEAYQTFLSVARSDHLGRQRILSPYSRFARIRMH